MATKARKPTKARAALLTRKTKGVKVKTPSKAMKRRVQGR
jgi:hypothetical protein